METGTARALACTHTLNTQPWGVGHTRFSTNTKHIVRCTVPASLLGSWSGPSCGTVGGDAAPPLPNTGRLYVWVHCAHDRVGGGGGDANGPSAIAPAHSGRPVGCVPPPRTRTRIVLL
eukprot:gene17316-biopygen14396